MVRQQNTKGAILEINIADEYYVYAQILDAGTAFFDYRSKVHLTDFSVLRTAPVLFVLAIYRDVVSQGRWLKVGKMDIREDLRVLPMKYIYDIIGRRYEFYDPNTGEITPATKAAVAGLEVSSVWDSNHVEDRIKSHYDGTPDIWTATLKLAEIKFPPKEE